MLKTSKTLDQISHMILVLSLLVKTKTSQMTKMEKRVTKSGKMIPNKLLKSEKTKEESTKIKIKIVLALERVLTIKILKMASKLSMTATKKDGNKEFRPAQRTRMESREMKLQRLPKSREVVHSVTLVATTVTDSKQSEQPISF